MCEGERMKWTGEERSSAVWSGWAAVRGRRDGFPGQGESRPDWAATETLSAASLPPKDSHPPPHPRAPRSCVSSLSSAAILSITFLSPPFVPPLPPAPFLHPPPLLVWAITDTQQWAQSRWGGWLRRWDEEIEGHKSPEMQWSNESGWL